MAVLLFGCENRSLSESEEFQPREIHESIDVHFDEITVDGIEYLILEKDNNNPHEGFGFMAFRANRLMEKQDSVLAYLRTISDMQVKMYARQAGISERAATQLRDKIYMSNLALEMEEIETLEKQDFSGRTIQADTAQ